ncbi:YugE family protein [Maribellus maritimus]|uniref:YugE family protein n=1 Tax=Maribellus maritimus TaxID=2870838 RepID=UPI001EE9D8AD|nr:YugE family protein [Maribellus maritimus]MCG6187003.1 YugE family protein [Maribellus maritimus]
MTNFQESKDRLEKIERIKNILTNWNPLGEQAKSISDLDNYDTEANDIYFHFVSEIDFQKSKNPLKRIQTITKEVLNEAFNLWLSDKECEKPAKNIMEILK